MASDSATIFRVPPDIIAHILSLLDTIQDLSIAIRSHRIFLDTFNDSPYSIASAIVKGQVHSDVFPLIIALLESSRVGNGDGAMTPRSVLYRLAKALSDPSQTAMSVPSTFSLRDLAYCSRNYAAAEFLAQALTNEVKPIAIQTIDFGRPISPELMSSEKARLVRAFIRFQVMCNLFCNGDHSGSVSDDSDDDDESETASRRLFFSLYSPWVNEQLMCAYVWLERILCQVCDELAWHDVDWGELPVDISDEPGENMRLQSFLSGGLPFLRDISRARSYAERAPLIQLDDYMSRGSQQDPSQQLKHRFPDERLVVSIDPADIEMPLQDWTAEQLTLLTRPADGVQDSTESSSFMLWLGANAERSIFGDSSEEQDEIDDTNLWQCGYNLWEWECYGPDPPTSAIKEACNKVRSRPPHFQRPSVRWDDEMFWRSQKQRSDIWLAGGSGYWPMNDVHDFSGIHGLSPDKIEKLLDKWRDEKHI